MHEGRWRESRSSKLGVSRGKGRSGSKDFGVVSEFGISGAEKGVVLVGYVMRST